MLSGLVLLANYFAEAVNASERAPMKAEAQFLAAWSAKRAAESESGQAQLAADQLQSFLTANEQSRFAPRAALLLGPVSALMGDHNSLPS